jgi:hypothetical protein
VVAVTGPVERLRAPDHRQRWRGGSVKRPQPLRTFRCDGAPVFVVSASVLQAAHRRAHYAPVEPYRDSVPALMCEVESIHVDRPHTGPSDGARIEAAPSADIRLLEPQVVVPATLLWCVKRANSHHQTPALNRGPHRAYGSAAGSNQGRHVGCVLNGRAAEAGSPGPTVQQQAQPTLPATRIAAPAATCGGAASVLESASAVKVWSNDGDTRGAVDSHSLLYGAKFLTVRGRKRRKPVHSYAPMSGAASRSVPSTSCVGAPVGVPLSTQGDPTFR